ncbi:hypothetical protein WA158_001034 [Blastocystis sp. Blastoise]
MEIDITQETNDKTFFYFSKDYGNEEFKLIELNKDYISDYEKGEKLYIKGTTSSKATLCSSSRSSVLQSVSTSNTVLICEDNSKESSNDIVVHGKVGYQIELVTNPMDPSALYSSLNSYKEGNGKSIQELWYNSIYSEKEIEEFLKSSFHCVCNSNKEWYSINNNDLYQYISIITTYILNNDLNINSFSKETILQNIQDPYPFMIEHVLSIYTKENENGTWSFKQGLLTTEIARHIFLTEGEWIPTTEYIQLLQAELPAEYTLDLSILSSLCILESQNGVVGYHYIDMYALPVDPKERYKHLFSIKSEWSNEELQYFINDLEKWGYGKLHDLNIQFCREVNKKNNDGTYLKVLVLKR